MHKLRKTLLPLLLVIAMLLVSAPTFAASSPTPKKFHRVVVIEKKWYTGRTTKPKHIVYDTNDNVVPKKYYTSSFKDNLHAGKASLTVKAKAPYNGTASTTFKIRRTKTRLKVTKPNKNTYHLSARIRNWKGDWIRDVAMYGGHVTFTMKKTKVATISKTGIVTRNKKNKGTVQVTVRVKGNNDIYPQTHKVSLKFS